VLGALSTDATSTRRTIYLSRPRGGKCFWLLMLFVLYKLNKQFYFRCCLGAHTKKTTLPSSDQSRPSHSPSTSRRSKSKRPSSGRRRGGREVHRLVGAGAVEKSIDWSAQAVEKSIDWSAAQGQLRSPSTGRRRRWSRSPSSSHRRRLKKSSSRENLRGSRECTRQSRSPSAESRGRSSRVSLRRNSIEQYFEWCDYMHLMTMRNRL